MPSCALRLMASGMARLPCSRFRGSNPWFLPQKITLAVTNVTSKNGATPLFKRRNAIAKIQKD